MRSTALGGKSMYRPKQLETWHVLTPGQLEEALRLALSRGAGRYTLREIYGDVWGSMRRTRRFGVLFKKAVRDGLLGGIRWVGQKSNRSQLYELTIDSAS
jgi:hypothetical protein